MEKKSRVTQADIAKRAGVSRGTVHRVLNQSGPVKAEVAARIQAIAQELGYRPSMAALSLVRAQKPLRIGVLVHSADTPFIRDMLSHMEARATYYAEFGIECVFRPMISVNLMQQMEEIDALVSEGIHGLIIMPVADERIQYRLQDLIAQNIPVVTINTDMPAIRRLCYIGQDHIQSGRACAGLMNALIGGCWDILMLTGSTYNL